MEGVLLGVMLRAGVGSGSGVRSIISSCCSASVYYRQVSV
jgi:hypothetical protein